MQAPARRACHRAAQAGRTYDVCRQALWLHPAAHRRDQWPGRDLVEIGITQNGYVEILSGLNENEIVAVDGAAFLTDGIAVSISNLK